MWDLSLLEGGVAVVTGSGSIHGIGFAIACRLAKLGMKIALSDLRATDLEAACQAMRDKFPEVDVEGFVCDVTKLSEVKTMYQNIKYRFKGSAIKFLGANAGILLPNSTILSGDEKEWDKTYSVNVLGVFHTLRVFVPEMVLQDVECIVEITASLAGVIFGSLGPYGTSKQAVVGIAEALDAELAAKSDSPSKSKVKVVVLCPGVVSTDLRLTSSETTGIEGQSLKDDTMARNQVDMFNEAWKKGFTAEQCVNKLFESIVNDEFYCIIDKSGIEYKLLERRMDSLRARKLRYNSAM